MASGASQEQIKEVNFRRAMEKAAPAGSGNG